MCIVTPPNEINIALKRRWVKAILVITAPEYAPGPKPSTRRSLPAKRVRSRRAVDVNKECGDTK